MPELRKNSCSVRAGCKKDNCVCCRFFNRLVWINNTRIYTRILRSTQNMQDINSTTRNYVHTWIFITQWLSVGHVYWESARPVGSGNVSIVSQPSHRLSRLQACFASWPCWLLALRDVELISVDQKLRKHPCSIDQGCLLIYLTKLPIKLCGKGCLIITAMKSFDRSVSLTISVD